VPGSYPQQSPRYGGGSYAGRSIRPYSVPTYIGRQSPSNDNTAGAGRPSRQTKAANAGTMEEIGDDLSRAKRRRRQSRELIGTVFRGMPSMALRRYAAGALQIGSVINAVVSHFGNPIGYSFPGLQLLYACTGIPGVRGPLATSGCFILQAIGGSARRMDEVYTTLERSSGFSTYELSMPLISRYSNVESWGHIPGAPVTFFPQQFPYPATSFPKSLPTGIPFPSWHGRFAFPMMHPSINPMFMMPSRVPMPAPWAIPYRLQPYYVPPGAEHNPVHGTMRGNTAPAPAAPVWAPALPPGGVLPPGAVVPPPWGQILVPGLYGGWGRMLHPVPWRKPPPGTKQKKIALKASGIAGVIRGIGAFTEGLDALDAIYQALPESLRKREQAKRHGRDPNPLAKLQILLRNLGKLDGPGAIENLINEQIQDTIIGKANRAGRTVNSFGGDGRGTAPTRLGQGPSPGSHSQGGYDMWGDVKIDVF